jgi:regulator of protease activity HflC (stomatin/prohibitin superfamily)
MFRSRTDTLAFDPPPLTPRAASDDAREVPSEPIAPPSRKAARGMMRGMLIRFAIVLAALAFVAVYLAPDIFVEIQSGDVGVMFRRFAGGTQTEQVVGEGLTFVPPWDQLFIYSTRVQECKHTMTVLTNDGLTVTLNLSIRYRPEREMVALLHQRVGPEYKERIVIPEVESVLRTTMSHFGMNEVYASDRGMVQQVISDSLDQVSEKYVQIDDVIVRSVQLPAHLTQIIEDKMAEKEKAAAYAYRLEAERKEAERKEIEATGLKKYNELLAGTLTPEILKWRGLEVTRDLAKSPNSKTIFLGNRSNDLPLLLDGQSK